MYKHFLSKGPPTSLISSASYFNLGIESFFVELSGDGTEFWLIKIIKLKLLACEQRFRQNPQSRSSSHLVLLMSGDRRSSRQFGGRRMLQSKIIWLADCSSAPQMHLWRIETNILQLFPHPMAYLPRVSRARGQSQFGRPHPTRSWRHRCEQYWE